MHQFDLSHVAVIGGGRWARIILETLNLSQLIPSSIPISVHTKSNAPAMNSWVQKSGYVQRIEVYDSLPQNLGKRSAVIIANKVEDHKIAAAYCLEQGATVLVEKPIATCYEDVALLTKVAEFHGGMLLPAHVFAFAEYLEVLVKIVSDTSAGSMKQVRIVWSDPRVEERYGELKSFDPAVSIISDWLPHIFSILSVFFIDLVPRVNHLNISRGGQGAEIKLSFNEVQCIISLNRNSEERIRIIEIETANSEFKMDFTLEPAILKHFHLGSECKTIIETEQRPLKKMLDQFILCVCSGSFDTRFDLKNTLNSYKIIDQLTPIYKEQQLAWFKTKGDSGLDSDMAYYLDEISHTERISSKIRFAN